MDSSAGTTGSWSDCSEATPIITPATSTAAVATVSEMRMITIMQSAPVRCVRPG